MSLTSTNATGTGSYREQGVRGNAYVREPSRPRAAQIHSGCSSLTSVPREANLDRA